MKYYDISVLIEKETLCIIGVFYMETTAKDKSMYNINRKNYFFIDKKGVSSTELTNLIELIERNVKYEIKSK